MNYTKIIRKPKLSTILAALAVILLLAVAAFQLLQTAQPRSWQVRANASISQLLAARARDAEYRRPITDVDRSRQYLVGAGIWLPLNHATENIVFGGETFQVKYRTSNSGTGIDSWTSLSIGRANVVSSVLGAFEQNCAALVRISHNKNFMETYERLAGTVMLDGKRLFVIKNIDRDCNAYYTESELNTLVVAVKNAQAY